jgi:DNA-directed RNA polymerase specialized sigma24 family protein
VRSQRKLNRGPRAFWPPSAATADGPTSAARPTAHAEAAADLTAEVFAAALASSGRFRRRAQPAVAWLYGIANNKLAASPSAQASRRPRTGRLGMEPLVLTVADGPTEVLIAGRGFQSGTTVSWGGRAATSVKVLSSNFLRATARRAPRSDR